MHPLILIPARFSATRLPGKPLADIHGKPMIVRVWERAMAAGIGRVAVATDTPEIAEAVRAAGGEAVLTRADHASGSDRMFEAAEALDPAHTHEVIVNVQGDVPTIAPSTICAVLSPLADARVDIATVCAPIHDAWEKDDSAVVKVAVAADGRALYFSRACIPTGDGPLLHHIGIYAYRRGALARFVALPQSPLEQREKLEQLRALEAGMTIGVAVVEGAAPLGVDTPETLERARAAWQPV